MSERNGSRPGLPAELRRRGTSAYWSTYETEMQRRLRRENASFHSVVYWRPGCTDVEELARNFRIIRDAGFDAVRCHNFLNARTPDGSLDFSLPDAWLEAASRAGVRIILHLTTQRLPDEEALEAAGLTREEFNGLAAEDPQFREATSILLAPPVSRYKNADSLLAWGGFGEPGAAELDLATAEDGRQFAAWLRNRYQSIEELDAAWNVYPETGPVVSSFDDAWHVARLPAGRTSINGASNARVNYGAQRDRYRFMVDRNLAKTAVAIDIIRAIDPDHPILTGSHQLFFNQPSLGWDIPKWAKLGDCHFSSIHMSWHFQPVFGEVDRPVYFQARQTRDYFKGGWTSAFETTGGPVQFSGGYGNHMDAGLMRRLCLSYLAAGNINLAFWTWNHRPGGWEGGEYGMTSLSGRLTNSGREAGRIASAARRYAGELWSADPAVDVGLIQSWDTDAIQLFEPERHDLSETVGSRMGGISSGTKLCHPRSWIGYSRALVNNQISWHYLLEEELAGDLVYNYPVLIAPFLRAISDDTVERLITYVQSGGVVIADVTFGYYDRWGKCRLTGLEDSELGANGAESLRKLFGAWVDQVHDNRTGDTSLSGERIPGFYGDLVVTDARPVLRFDDGRPAAVEMRHQVREIEPDVGGSASRSPDTASGAAVLVGFDLGTFCFEPGNELFESIVERLVHSYIPRRFESSLPMTMRLRGPDADHYFLVNDGPATDAILTVSDAEYTAGIDVLADPSTGAEVAVGSVISIPVTSRSGAWVRFEREGE